MFLCPLAAGLFFPGEALAVGESCSVTASGVIFNTYNPFNSSALDVSGNIRVTCTNSLVTPQTVNYTISLSTGGNNSYNPRVMANGANSLTYNLYKDSLRTIVFGDGSGSTQTVSGSVTIPAQGSASQDHTVYGRVPALQNAFVGDYSDSITVTLNY